MTEARKILDMIEAVDPNDFQTLDYIDALVWCYLNQKTYRKHTQSDYIYGDCYGKPVKVGVFIQEHVEEGFRSTVPYSSANCYTRSRAALTSGGWQKIDGAPRNGTDYLVLSREKNCKVCHHNPYHNHYEVCGHNLSLESLRSMFTHWMPLPPQPPKDAP